MTTSNNQTLAQLQTVDPRVLHFTPLGLGGAMQPEDAADYHQRLLASLVLADDVAQTTRQKFEQLCAGYRQGLLCYELFTLVADAARLTMEHALRDRFAAHHNGTITVQDKNGDEHQIVYTTYSDFYDQYKKKVRGTKIGMGSSEAWIGFSGMLEDLLRWARREGLLRGQRNRHIERAKRDLRNLTAHGTYHLLDPFEAYRTLSDLMELINHLWGQPTPGGRLHPAPITRDVVAIRWNNTTGSVRAGHAAQLAYEREDNDEFTYILVRAAFCPSELEDPHLMEYDARHATTQFPSQYLWGPGTRAEAVAWFEREAPEPDTCDYLDQIFVIRVHDGRIHLPMYPAIAASLPKEEQPGTWHAVRADGPYEVFAHTRAVAAAEQGHALGGECAQCPVHTIASGDLTQVLQAAQTAGVDITAVQVPDVRTVFADVVAPRSAAIPS
ncbi:hypothetical protein ME763_24395 [Streptomyces murinus]|uniref:hypothetical protein n=1 Tax=Streptomyces murinus TaxID=33900 RepID=UPI000A1F1C35|nr:hypothetical protein [Streptomyces murinus]WDO08520.1 hypothetical protein ME763_24395 [Streptomyces murinus]